MYMSGGSAFDFATPESFDQSYGSDLPELSRYDSPQYSPGARPHRYEESPPYSPGGKARYEESPQYSPGGRAYRYEESPSYSPDGRPRSREITPDLTVQNHWEDGYGGPLAQSTGKKSKKFLKKVQHELDEQRAEWGEEARQMQVEKLAGVSLVNSPPGKSRPQGTNSYVDTSTGSPIFKAYVDVREFPASSVNVNVDTVRNKVIVTAEHRNSVGTVTRTFTQKVQLPRYADEQKVRSFLSKSGLLKIEVPLMYYFPMHTLDKKGGKPAKSFVNEIRTLPTGQQCLEILVNTGSGYTARDLHVRVIDDDKLVITAERPESGGRVHTKLIKQYTLPKLADPDTITSRLGKDGRLSVTVPLRRSSRETTPTPPR